MLDQTKVGTTFTTGTTINLGPIATKMFLLNTAITVIVQTKSMKCEYGEYDTKEITLDLPEYDQFVEDYCRGVHASFTTGMVEQYVQILYRFVQDCVLNRSVAGLYLLNETPRHGYKFKFYELITKALDVYMEEVEHQYYIFGEEDKFKKLPKYNEYNEEFLALFKG